MFWAELAESLGARDQLVESEPSYIVLTQQMDEGRLKVVLEEMQRRAERRGERGLYREAQGSPGPVGQHRPPPVL